METVGNTILGRAGERSVRMCVCKVRQVHEESSVSNQQV